MIRIKWTSPLEICIFAEMDMDIKDLREVLNPHGTKAILIEHQGLRVIPAGQKVKEYPK